LERRQEIKSPVGIIPQARKELSFGALERHGNIALRSEVRQKIRKSIDFFKKEDKISQQYIKKDKKTVVAFEAKTYVTIMLLFRNISDCF